MMRRLPIVPTILVALVVIGCIWGGVWNLGRAKLHAVELQKLQAASHLPPIAFPTIASKVVCEARWAGPSPSRNPEP